MKQVYRLLPVLLFLLLCADGGKIYAQLGNYLEISQDTLLFDLSCGQSRCLPLDLRSPSRGVTIVSITQPQSSFSETSNQFFPQFVPPERPLQLNYCFTPTIPGVTSENRLIVTVDTGDANNLARDTILLRGISRSASIDLNPPSMAFGAIVFGQEFCQPLTITNTGNASLPLNELQSLASPYRINPPLAGILLPGASITVDVCFAPPAEGFYHDTLILGNGDCRGPVTLPISGAGIKLSSNVGPVLQISPSLTDFDTTRCGTTKCRDITIRNVGSTVSTITNPGQFIAPFTGTFPPTPITLLPDSAITIRVCYSPPDAPRVDSLLLPFVGDSRYPLTISLLFDVSGSMKFLFGPFGNRVAKITAAHTAGEVFVASMERDSLRGIVDTASIYTFAGINTHLQRASYTTDSLILATQIPSSADTSSTCIWEAMVKTIRDMIQQNLPGRRVLIVLTDGNNMPDCEPYFPPDVIAAAQAAGIRIYTIGIGAPSDVDETDLKQIASRTGGGYYFAPDSSSLIAVYRQISDDLSRGANGYLILRGEGTSPVLQLTPSIIDFDSVRVDSNRCLDVQLTNVGNAPYPGGPIEAFSSPYSMQTPIAPPLNPGDSVTLQICFGPDRLRVRRDTIILPYYRCSDDTVSTNLVGVGYDSVVVEMKDIYTGRPGSIVEIPIYLNDPMPEFYEVDSLFTEIRFNKTMLAPARDDLGFVQTYGTASAGMEGRIESIRYDGDTAVIGIRFDNGRLNSTLPTSELARLRFRVLLGNAMETPITGTRAWMADGNPKVGRRNPALFRIDSLCYLPARLLDASARYDGLIKSVVADGGKLAVTYDVMMEEGVAPLESRLELYDMQGRLVRHLDQRSLSAGEEVTILSDPSGIATGIYLIRLQVGQLVLSAQVSIGW